MKAIIKRELRAYFTSPLGYIILTALMLFGGIYYHALIQTGYADLTYLFNAMITIIFFVIPIITMRCFSEEKKQKTDQLFMTSPVSVASVVIGKYIACLSFFSIFVAAMAVYNFVFYFFGASPDIMIFLGNIIGIELFAGSLIAIGVFISALTESQVVAAVGSFAVSFMLMLLDTVSTLFDNAIVTAVCDWISFSDRYYTFTDGIFDVGNAIFFISIIVVFLFLTVRAIDRKRWA